MIKRQLEMYKVHLGGNRVSSSQESDPMHNSIGIYHQSADLDSGYGPHQSKRMTLPTEDKVKKLLKEAKK